MAKMMSRGHAKDITPSAGFERQTPLAAGARRAWGYWKKMENVRSELLARSEFKRNGWVVPDASDKRVQSIRNALRLHHSMTYIEFVDKLGNVVTESKYREGNAGQKPESIGRDIERIPSSELNPQERAELVVLVNAIEEAITNLEWKGHERVIERNKQLLFDRLNWKEFKRFHCFERMSLEELHIKYGMTKENVRQTIKRALKYGLEEELRRHSIDAYSLFGIGKN
ncbi:hypothetical protein DRN67_00350 [Candidatus Micrarchaeota archaeon]|nr:MAG: hypothetical protein DRN67_00350 [Candidatus Micrarchaeota archaeon]